MTAGDYHEALILSARAIVAINQRIHLLDVVALAEDLPERKLYRGQAGTAVEELAPGVFEVDFSDDARETFALCALREEQLLVLHYELLNAA
jgi:hypothetical protein